MKLFLLKLIRISSKIINVLTLHKEITKALVISFINY